MEPLMEKVPPQIPLAAAPFKPRTPSLSSRSKNFVWASIRITLIASLFFAYLWYIKQPNTHPQTLQVDNGPPVSCTHDANITDPCLVERPFGLVLLAQMYNPNVGAIDPWLIHGLWGNFCNGSKSTETVSSEFPAELHVVHVEERFTYHGSERHRCRPVGSRMEQTRHMHVDSLPELLRELPARARSR